MLSEFSNQDRKQTHGSKEPNYSMGVRATPAIVPKSNPPNAK
jgi:hypothetical protein